MVDKDGSDHEIELCQVDSNPKKVVEGAGMRRLRKCSMGRRPYTQKYNWIRIVENDQASIIPHSRAPVAVIAACNPLSLAPKRKNGSAVRRHRRDPCADTSIRPQTGSSTELQLLLPFVTYCLRHCLILSLGQSTRGCRTHGGFSMAQTTAKHLFAAPTKISLRVDEELYRRLKDAACESLRSLNAEVVLRLRESLQRETAQTAT